MVEYNKVNVKLSNSQLNNLKTSAKKWSGVPLGMNVKTFVGSNLLHELLLKLIQNVKLRNAFENNKIINIKLSKTQIAKMN